MAVQMGGGGICVPDVPGKPNMKSVEKLIQLLLTGCDFLLPSFIFYQWINLKLISISLDN